MLHVNLLRSILMSRALSFLFLYLTEIHIDIVSPLPSSHGFNNLLTVWIVQTVGLIFWSIRDFCY